MSFLSSLFDFIYAPSGASDSASNSYSPSMDFSDSHSISSLEINPASGLPMIEHTGIDVCGNVFGTNSHSHDFSSCTNDTNSMFTHDCGNSMFDSGCGSSPFDSGWPSFGGGSLFD